MYRDSLPRFRQARGLVGGGQGVKGEVIKTETDGWVTSFSLSSSFWNRVTTDLTPSGLKYHSLPKTNLLIMPSLVNVVEIMVCEAAGVPAGPLRWGDGAKAILTSVLRKGDTGMIRLEKADQQGTCQE